MPHASNPLGIIIILTVRGFHTLFFRGLWKKTLMSLCLWEVWPSSLGPAVGELGASPWLELTAWPEGRLPWVNLSAWCFLQCGGTCEALGLHVRSHSAHQGSDEDIPLGGLAQCPLLKRAWRHYTALCDGLWLSVSRHLTTWKDFKEHVVHDASCASEDLLSHD